VQDYHLLWHGTFVRSLLIILALLCLLYFEPVEGSLVVKWCTKICHIHGKRWKCCLWIVTFGLQHKKEVIHVLDSFISFFFKYEKRKAHNMFFKMLDPRFKTFHLISSFIGREQGKVIIKKYDKKSSFPMLLKCYYHMHPLVESKGVLLTKRSKKTRVWLSLRWQTTQISQQWSWLIESF